MVLDTGSKLVTYLRRHKRVGNTVLLKIFIEGNKIQTQFLRNDINRRAASQCRVRIHHIGVKTVAGIGCYLASWLEIKHLMVPVAEGHEVAVNQLATLGHTCRT